MSRLWNVDPWLFTVFLLTVLMCLPFLRSVYSLGDEAELLNGGVRLLHGEIIYKDFFEFLPPGGFVLTSCWLGIMGNSINSARSLGILVITGVACLAYVNTRQTTQNAILAGILTIFWVVASQGYVMTQLSHHWLTTLFSMTAFCVALASLQRAQRSLWWALTAGAMEGAAVMVTPTCGALAWLAAATFFLRLGRKDALAYVAASGCVPLLLLVYLGLHENLASAYADCIQYTGAHYASIQGVPFGHGIGAQTYPLVSLFPAVAFLTILICLFDRRNCLTDRHLQLCAVYAIAGFIGCFPRPDVGRIDFETPLALPLFGYCLASIGRGCRPIIAAILAEVLITICLPSALSFWFIVRPALQAPLTPTPSGDVSIFGQPGAAQILARLTIMPRGDAYFFYPYIPLMSFLTERQQVSKYEMFVPQYTTPSQYQDACISVMQTGTWVVVDRKWTDPKYWKTAFPAMTNPRPPETQAFETALSRGFEQVFQAGTFELRHRTAAASTALCTGIMG